MMPVGVSAYSPEQHGRRRRTLALEVLLDALEADVAWCAYNQDAQEALHVIAEPLFLAKSEQDGLDECPQESDRDEEQPQQDEAALEVDRHRAALSAGERLRAECVERSGTTEGDTPACCRGQCGAESQETGHGAGAKEGTHRP